MSTFVIIYLVFMGLASGFLFFMLWRNQQVYQFRTRHSRELFKVAREDLDRTATTARQNLGTPNQIDYYGEYRKRQDARLAWLDSVSYEDMIRRFWKPLDAFYVPLDLNDPLATDEWPNEVGV